MDRIAQVVGLSPVEIRRRNFLKPGQTTTTGQTVNEQIDLDKLLERGLELSDYHAKKQRFAKENPATRPQKGNRHRCVLARRGIHGIGRALSRFRGWRGSVRRWQRSRIGLKHGIWTGNKNRALPDRGGSAGVALRRCRNRPTGHAGGTEQRAHGSFTDGDGSGKTGAIRGNRESGKRWPPVECSANRIHPKNFAPRVVRMSRSMAHSAAWRAMSSPTKSFGTMRNIAAPRMPRSRGQSMWLKLRWI